MEDPIPCRHLQENLKAALEKIDDLTSQVSEAERRFKDKVSTHFPKMAPF